MATFLAVAIEQAFFRQPKIRKHGAVMRPIQNQRRHIGGLRQVETGVAGLAGQLLHIERLRAGHPDGIGDKLHVCIDPHVEAQILKLGAEVRQPFRLRLPASEIRSDQGICPAPHCRQTRFVRRRYRRHPARPLAADRRRVYAECCIIDHLRQRVLVVGCLRADDDAKTFAALAHGGAQIVEQIRIRRLGKFVKHPK